MQDIKINDFPTLTSSFTPDGTFHLSQNVILSDELKEKVIYELQKAGVLSRDNDEIRFQLTAYGYDKETHKLLGLNVLASSPSGKDGHLSLVNDADVISPTLASCKEAAAETVCKAYNTDEISKAFSLEAQIDAILNSVAHDLDEDANSYVYCKDFGYNAINKTSFDGVVYDLMIAVEGDWGYCIRVEAFNEGKSRYGYIHDVRADELEQCLYGISNGTAKINVFMNQLDTNVQSFKWDVMTCKDMTNLTMKKNHEQIER